VIPDARELHRVIAASVRELLAARLEAQAGPVDGVPLPLACARMNPTDCTNMPEGLAIQEIEAWVMHPGN
jgi:hypothetical protein